MTGSLAAPHGPFRRQLAFAECLRAFDGIAMLAGRGHFALRTLEQPGLPAVAGRLAVAARVHAHAHDRALRKAFAGDAVLKRLGRALHLYDPDELLAIVVAHERIARLVERDEM